MLRTITVLLAAFVLTFTLASVADARGKGNPNPAPVVYVTGQGLYYDSIVAAKQLPPKGRFQPLVVGENGRLETPYGPGDRGYVGGRWWMDSNGNGVQDEDDTYFSCPLLGPGRETP